MHKLIFILVLSSILFACSTKSHKYDSGPPPGSVDVSSIPDATPKKEPKSKYGNPESYVVFGKRYYVMNSSNGFIQRGIASWYGRKFHGRRTSSGETYDMYAMTAAHKELPLPTFVQVTNLRNRKQVIVRVNDRGPFHGNRIIDLSYTAAAKLDIIKSGTGLVEVKAINNKNYNKAEAPVLTKSSYSDSFGFYIQVGAFSQRYNADNMRRKLDGLGENLVQVNEIFINGDKVYRVRIGPITNIDFADNIVMKLDEYGITDHHVVVD